MSREAEAKAPLGVRSEVTIASLKSKALLGNAKLVSSGRSKALSAQIASSCEARPYGKAILASPSAKKKAFKAKPKASQPKGTSF